MSQYITRLQVVIDANKTLQKRARELNIRAGKVIFPILSQTEWEERLKGLLSGARCAMEIADVSALLLPTLDEAKVTEILAANPDSIRVGGMEFQVTYTSSGLPFISLQKEQVELVKGLPDEGITLPGGRVLEVRFIYDSYWSSSYFGDSNIPSLKGKVANWMNRNVWDNWGKPTLQLPNLETEVFPAIQEATYGTCQLTGASLKAFGTVVKNNRYWSSDPEFKTQWFQDNAEAEKANAEAKAYFEQKIAEAKVDKARRIVWETQIAPLKTEIENVRGNLGWGDSLRNQIDSLPYLSSGSSLEELNNYKAQAEKLLEEIKAELAGREEAKRREEEERQRAEEKALEDEKWAEEVQEFVSGLDYPVGYLFVTADKKLFVNCGKSTKMGKVEVTPCIGERENGLDGAGTPDEDGRECMWQEIPIGKKIVVKDLSRAGNVQSKFIFGVTEEQLDFESENGFFPGMWAIAEELEEGEDRGEGITYLYPVISYRHGERQLPEEVLCINMAELPEEPAAKADTSALLAKWGDKNKKK